MGFQVHARIVVGIPVEVDDFWHTTGFVSYCPACKVERPGKHCSECGRWLSKRMLREPRPPLQAQGDLWGCPDPEKTWVRLTSGTSDAVRVFPVDALLDYRTPPAALVLGRSLGEVRREDFGPLKAQSAPTPVNLASMDRAILAVRETAHHLGIPVRSEAPEVYLSLATFFDADPPIAPLFG